MLVSKLIILVSRVPRLYVVPRYIWAILSILGPIVKIKVFYPEIINVASICDGISII